VRHASSEILDAVWEVVTRRSLERSEAATKLLERNLHIEGALARRDDELWAGNRLLNRDRDILPQFAQATGLGYALYVGNRRIAAATVLDAGPAPEIGGFTTPDLVEQVLRRGEVFKGTLKLDNRECIVVARPLYASGGEEFSPIGMIEAFQDRQAHFDVLATAARYEVDDKASEAEERADGMDSIIHYIDDVARRLQLLALNGNIIAAQAGEHGRAFRVVCRELGVLADQSKQTGGEVRALITLMGLDRDLDGGFDSAFLDDDERDEATGRSNNLPPPSLDSENAPVDPEEPSIE